MPNLGTYTILFHIFEIVNNTLLSTQQYKITGCCPVTETITSTITSNSSEKSRVVSDI